MTLPPQPLVFHVSYRLGEYISMLSEYSPRSVGNAAAMQVAKASIWAKLLPSSKWFERICIYLIAPPIFLYKVFRVGQCTFSVDTERIERTSKTGPMSIPWKDVAFVQRLTEGYLVELERGGMPLPYRCFPGGARGAFELLVPAGKLVGSKSGA